MDYQNPERCEQGTLGTGNAAGERNEKIPTKGTEAGREGKLRKLPCRVVLKIRGVEWFIYNRSPAYDAIYRNMRDGEPPRRTEESPVQHKNTAPTYQNNDGDSKSEQVHPDGEQNGKDRKYDDTFNDEKADSVSSVGSHSSSTPASAPFPELLALFPIGVECNRGAMVMGNRNTHSVLTAKFESATGTINARGSRPCDQYKQIFEFDFVHPVIDFKYNKDYAEPQLSEGAKLHSHLDHSNHIKPKSRWFGHLENHGRVRHALNSLRDYLPYRSHSIESFSHPHAKSTADNILTDDSAGVYGQSRWLGLTRYLDDDNDLVEQERWKAVEYGQFPTIIDSPRISMSIYWDVPGLVPIATQNGTKSWPGSEQDINGDDPPDWGIELRVCGGTIHYGPWADRQRSDLQGVFFPTLYKDAVPAARLISGQRRVSTVMKVVLEIEEQVTLRVPTREESKDWRWRGHQVTPAARAAKTKQTKHHGKFGKSKKPSQTSEVRPAGWIDVKFSADTTVTASIDLIARNDGYHNLVDIDLKGLEISSSVNHGLLWRSRSQIISCNLSNPLAWNGLRQWNIDFHDKSMELYILRDHMYLLTDLINDWTSGPPGHFHTFVPFEYSMGLHFNDFKLYLNANDSNIVNNPSDLEDNTFVVISGKDLKANLAIASKTFRPARSQVKFKAEVSDGEFHLHTPPRNTQHTFLKSSNVASLKYFRLDGSYNYYSTTSPNLTDTLMMDLYGLSPKIVLYGFLVRYFMKIKDNYFGDDIHFRTLEEYQDQMNDDTRRGPQDTVSVQHNRISNDLDVILSITAEDLCILLPAHLYSSDENVRLDVVSVTSDLRITNYYMDLAVSSSPVAFSHTPHADRQGDQLTPNSSTQIFIDGLQILGHRLFGLPPTEPTYVCNWDFDVGPLLGECSIMFVRCLASCLRCFGFTFEDAENALPPLYSTDVHDVTFLRARVQSISLGLQIERSGLLFNTDAVDVTFNDWGGMMFSDRLHVLLPQLTLAIVDAHGLSMASEIPQDSAKTHALLQTTVEIRGISRKQDFKAVRLLQQSHIALHDARTHRVPWLIHDHEQRGALEVATLLNKTVPPAMPFPFMPEPTSLKETAGLDRMSLDSGRSDSSPSVSSRRSSFLMDKNSERDEQKTVYTPRSMSIKSGQPRLSRRFSKEDSNAPVLSTRHSAAHEDFNKSTRPSVNFPRPKLSFSSPYKRPYFPLLATKVDLTDLPDLPSNLSPDYITSDDDTLKSLQTQPTEEKNALKNSSMLNFDQGIQAFCHAEALFLMVQMLETFQAYDAETLLDDLQIDTMTSVLETGKASGSEIKNIDLRVFIPSISVRFMNTARTTSMDASRKDHYDLTLDRLIVTATSSKRISSPQAHNDQSQFSIHAAVDQLNCSVKELLPNSASDQAIISLTTLNPVFWMLHGTSAAADLQSEDFEIAGASRKIDYISSLLNETLVLTEKLALRVTTLRTEEKSRIQLIMMLLTTEGNDVADPPFLTRVSYVLRSTAHHIRLSESWRMISRLRYVYMCLTDQTRGMLHGQCMSKSVSCPPDAAQRIASSFERWQAWDSKQVESSLLIQKVYGELLNGPVSGSGATTPLKVAVRARVIRAVLEPGSKQNEIVIDGLVIGLTTSQPLISNDISSPELREIKGSTLQIHCVEVAIRLNWTLLGVLENIVETVQTNKILRANGKGVSRKSQGSPGRHGLHMTISSEVSILNCDSPNLKIVSVCNGLQTSIVTFEESSQDQGSSVSVILNAATISSEIRNHSTVMTSYKLRQPMIFGSKQRIAGSNIKEAWKLVGSGQDVLFQLSANPLQLIEAADCFLEYEIAHLLKWTKSMQSPPASSQPLIKSPKQGGLPKARIALFLESYLLSLKILPSLTYQISGTRARSTFKLGEREQFGLGADFDLDGHSHTFQAERRGSDVANILSTLKMPPINARFFLDLAPPQKSVEFSALVESIVFDASAVHAIFIAINRPEIISLASNIKSEVSVFQSHYEGIFGTTRTDQKFQTSEPILYTGGVNLASLSIRARTSNSLTMVGGAELYFKVSRMQLKATNKDLRSGTVMAFPELDVQFKDINLDLLRFKKLDPISCGNITIKAMLQSISQTNEAGELVRFHQFRSSSLKVNVYSETAPVIVAILVHLQETLKTVDLSQEVQALKKLRQTRQRNQLHNVDADRNRPRGETEASAMFNVMFSLEMGNIAVVWNVENSVPASAAQERQNLILSFTKIDLATRKQNAARLLIENFQLQMVPVTKTSTARSLNSALLPEVLFNVAYVSTGRDLRLAFQFAGKSLDLQLTSQFILPASILRRSIGLSIQQVRTATADWNASASTTAGQTKNLMGDKRLASLLVDADFAGAVVFIQGQSIVDPHLLALNVLRGGRLPQHGRYNQFTPENASNSSTTLRAPGVAVKIEYKNAGPDAQSLNAEMKVDASTNVLYPTVVPLIMELSSAVKDVVGEPSESKRPAKPSFSQPKFLEDERLRGADPTAIFGNCRLNLGLRICRQEFSLSCQPIARVAAIARFDDIYITVNTVQSPEHGKFFTVSGAFTRLQASVQHVYSRESTGSFEVESIVVSLMNSKHISTVDGISAILNVSPMMAQINGKQAQDFLLFREIWVPPEIRGSDPPIVPIPASEPQALIVQRYQQIAATGAFPWNATVSIAKLDVQVDLGQSLGKSAFVISNLWVSSKKKSDWEQNLCLGFERMAVNSTGRMSGFVELEGLKVRTSIQWPVMEEAQNQTPLVQASLSFDQLRVKAAFDYQAFAISDIDAFYFLMYNVRDLQNVGHDRLVGVLDGDKVEVFCTTTSASQILALYQAFQRLYQEKLAAYQASLQDIERFLRRKSSINTSAMRAATKPQEDLAVDALISSLKLQTDVVVTLKAVNIGAFPGTFFDNQIFKLEAFDASARFAVILEDERIHSTLGMTLGQLRIALASVAHPSVPKTLGEVTVADVVTAATGSRGGTILKVPKLVATMETWQRPGATDIGYVFKSSFQGKVDVGWNYSRISYIRGMWTSHTRALAQRLGKPLPQSAVQITGGPRPEGDDDDENQAASEGESNKITAVVNVPQSKYEYTALQPPIIETPQLRDMGEATPPLEWIGLHRERLPNLTHQIVIVPLLEVAREVDDAYSKILGSS